MPASDLAKPLVSGRVNADTYKVREGRVINKKISVKKNWPFPLLCKAVPKTGSFRWNNSSFKRLTTPAPMRSTGGRLFVDVTRMLSSSESRQTIIDNLGKSDPLIKDALQTLMERVL